MLGFEKDFREGTSRGLVWSVSYFEKHFEKLVIQSTGTRDQDGTQVPEIYNNNGSGKAAGIESMLRFELAPFTGWLSTPTLEVREMIQLRASTSQYDQTHNINLIGSYNFPRNWVASARYRYVTGNPFTPVVTGTFDSDNDVYVPTRGPIYSERLEPFQQLDIRVDKKFIIDQEVWSLYLDVQNVLNQKNVESLRYSYDYSAKENITGLPMLPALGVKGEF